MGGFNIVKLYQTTYMCNSEDLKQVSRYLLLDELVRRGYDFLNEYDGYDDYDLVYELKNRGYDFLEDVDDDVLIEEIYNRKLTDRLITNENTLADNIVMEINCGKIDMNKVYDLLERLTNKLVVRK